MSWIQYANQGAIRDKPLSDELLKSLSYLGDMGVTMEVFSGGQDAHGGKRTGSTRHDHGNAADVFFYKDGRRLDWSNPDDLPIFEQIVSKGRANGVTGFGAGDGYMRPGSMHIGFGNEAVWGAGGKGENAPDWLRAAYHGSTPAQPPAATPGPARGRAPTEPVMPEAPQESIFATLLAGDGLNEDQMKSMDSGLDQISAGMQQIEPPVENPTPRPIQGITPETFQPRKSRYAESLLALLAGA